MGCCHHEMHVVLPGSAVSPMQRRFNEIYIWTGSMLSISGRLAMVSIGQKLQNVGHRVTAIKIFDCLNDCVLLCMDTFGEILVFNDGTECHYDCYSNIQSTLQHHLTLLANVCINNVDFGGRVDDDYDLLQSMKYLQRFYYNYVLDRDTNYCNIRFDFITEYARDANRKRQPGIKQRSEPPERCLKQAYY